MFNSKHSKGTRHSNLNTVNNIRRSNLNIGNKTRHNNLNTGNNTRRSNLNIGNKTHHSMAININDQGHLSNHSINNKSQLVKEISSTTDLSMTRSNIRMMTINTHIIQL